MNNFTHRGSCKGLFSKIRQEGSHDAEKGHVGTEIIDGLNSVAVSEVAEHSRGNASDTESESEEEAGNHAELCREEFLSIKQYCGEGRREHEAGTETEYDGRCEADMGHEKREGGCPENRGPDDGLTAITVSDRSSDERAYGRRDNKYKEEYLRKGDGDSEFVNEIEGVVARKACHVDVFREYEDDYDTDCKYGVAAREREYGMTLRADLTIAKFAEIVAIPPAYRSHGPETEESKNQEKGDIAAVVRRNDECDEQRTDRATEVSADLKDGLREASALTSGKRCDARCLGMKRCRTESDHEDGDKYAGQSRAEGEEEDSDSCGAHSHRQTEREWSAVESIANNGLKY